MVSKEDITPGEFANIMGMNSRYKSLLVHKNAEIRWLRGQLRHIGERISKVLDSSGSLVVNGYFYRDSKCGGKFGSSKSRRERCIAKYDMKS